MLEELGWLSINQICAQTRLIEAWKTINVEDYCLGEVLRLKKKSEHMCTRSNKQDLFETSQPNKFANASFAQKTSQIWNECPKSVKEAKSLTLAKKAIRQFVKTLPI